MGTSVTTASMVSKVWSFWTIPKDDAWAMATISNSRPISPQHLRIWSGPEIRGPQERKLCNNSNGKCVTISALSFFQVSVIIDLIM
jgi:hypothetical protein